jgi:hemolysin III
LERIAQLHSGPTVPTGSALHTGSSALDRSADEELMNTLTHGTGLVAAVVGAYVMMGDLLARGDARTILGCTAYLATLIAVYSMSTLSHGSTSPYWKTFFRQLDQGFIYLLIVGTYTPFALAYMRGGHWWMLLAMMWVVAVVGCATKLLLAHRVDVVSITSYMLLAWTPIVVLPTLWHTAPLGAFESVIAGGICYSVGILFFIHDQRYRYFHACWHLCVMAGCTCHFLCILVYIVRGGV